MAVKSKSVIPEGYEDREFSLEDWQKAQIASALEKSRTREDSYRKPVWWSDMKHGVWEDCIATALSNYIDGEVPTGNRTLESDHEKWGFAKLNEGEKLQPGDIVQYHEYDRPYHSVVVDTVNDDGSYTTNYSNGFGEYHKNSSYWNGTPNYKIYRFIGTPAQRAEIEEHNRKVAEHAPKHIDAPVRTIPVQPVSAESSLFDVAKLAK